MVKRTYEEINAKIKAGEAVVVTAEEIIPWFVKRNYRNSKNVDVVTNAPLGPCVLREFL